MIVLPVASFLAADQRASDLPAGVIAGDLSAANYLLYTSADLFSATIPPALGVNLFEGSKVLSSRFMGLHTTTAAAGAVRNVLARSHDQAPRWSQQNTSAGVFVDAGMGAWLTAQKATGAETIVTIFHTPNWASARPSETGDPYGSLGALAEPASMATLQAYTTWLVTTYGAQLDYLEVWNEPKYTNTGSSYFSGTPAKLAEMARTINQAAKAVKPSIKIMGVGATGCVLQTWAPNDLSGLDFTDKFLAASDGAVGAGKDWIDVLTVHTYEHTGANDIGKLQYLKAHLDGIKATRGINSAPVWSTEFGFITPLFTAYAGPNAGRMRALARYALWHAVAGIDRAVMYSYGSTLGWGGDAESNTLWNAWCDLFNGATLTRVNRIGSGLAAVINGQNVLV